MTRLSRVLLLVSVGLAVGCTVILGIDKDYRPTDDAATSGVGGVGGVGGAASGGSGGTPTCAPDEKLCIFPTEGGIIQQCLKPSPLVGCSPQNCTPCDGAPNADPICNGDQCSLQCIANFEPCQGRCEPVGTCGGGGTGGSSGTGGVSGTGGTGGTGGSTGSSACDPSQCQNMCNITGPFRCCKFSGTCGCTFDPTLSICY